MFEVFTNRARKVMAMANQEAQRSHNKFIDTEHILFGLIKEGSGVGFEALKNLCVDVYKLRMDAEQHVTAEDKVSTLGRLPETPPAKKVIEYAIEEAKSLKHEYIGTRHILLGLLRVTDGIAAQALMKQDISIDKVREEIKNIHSEEE